MFKLQSLFAECPAGGSISYEVTVPVENMSSDLKITVIMPDGKEIEPEINEKVIKLSRQDGFGLWRFDVRLHSKGNMEGLFDNHLVDVVILEETEEAVRAAVDRAINSMNGRQNVSKVASLLYKEMNGKEIPEVLRRACFRREEDRLKYEYSYLLLEWLVEKPKAKPYLAIIAEIAADIQCVQSASYLIGSSSYFYGSSILGRLMIKPQDKWMYYLRILSEAPKAMSVPYNNPLTGWCEIAANKLSTGTPPSFKAVVLQVAEEIVQSDPTKASDIAILFKTWNHKKGMPLLLTALDMEPLQAGGICPVLEALNYREAIPQLREILSMIELDKGGSVLLDLLSKWNDEGSIDIIIDKLEMIQNTSTISSSVNEIIGSLKKFNNPSIRDRIKSIQANSSPEKAKCIEQCLARW